MTTTVHIRYGYTPVASHSSELDNAEGLQACYDKALKSLDSKLSEFVKDPQELSWVRRDIRRMTNCKIDRDSILEFGVLDFSLIVQYT